MYKVICHTAHDCDCASEIVQGTMALVEKLWGVLILRHWGVVLWVETLNSLNRSSGVRRGF